MTPDLTINSKHSVGKRIAANTGLMVGAKILAVTLGIFTLWIATRALSPVEFGTVVFLHAYMLFFAEVATFQNWQSIIRFGTDDLKNEDCDSLAELINFGVKVDVISVIFAYLASVGLFGLVAWIVQTFPALAPNEGLDVGTLQKYAALYCLVVLARQTGTAVGIFRLFDKFTVLAFEALVMPIIRFVGALYALYAGWGLEGFLAVWFTASLVSYIVMFGMGIWELNRRHLLGMVWKAKYKFSKPREGLWSFMIKSNIDSTLATGSLHLPMLMVMALFGAAWSGVYKFAEELAKFLSEGFKLLDQVIYPELAKLVAHGDASKIWRIVIRAAFALLGIGTLMSLVVFFAGPSVLGVIFGPDYRGSAPLASLLVPAAAMLGIITPLYPIFYAADKPERAIYARGAALLVYILSFLVFSFTIGKMAPGWAALAGNTFAVFAVIWTAKRTLNKTIANERAARAGTPMVSAPRLTLVGNTSAKLWGLPLYIWQTRAYKKAGCDLAATSGSGIWADVNWILSANLGKAFVARPHTALIENDTIIAVNGAEKNAPLCGSLASKTNFEDAGLTPLSPNELAGNYDKALRKTETPYALDSRVTPLVDIMQRQYNSSYKGITDFVTKYFWPRPAFYATRICAALKLTPNMVTTLSLIMMFVALYYFWQGAWVLGFISAWFMTFLDTVDGKLARTTMTYSTWGNIYDHGIDLIHPPFWYLAWYVGLGGSLNLPVDFTDPLVISLMAIFAGYVADRLIEGLFILLHGFHIHVWRPVNSALRFITARRNPNMFIFMIGIMLTPLIPQAGHLGFHIVAIWTWICIAFNIGVVVWSVLTRRDVKSWMDAST